MKKQYLPIVIGVILLLLVGGGVFAFTRMRGGNQEEQAATNTKKRLIAEPNKIAVAERPYIQIIPLADGHNLTIKFVSLKKAAESVEYEIDYQSGTLIQGGGNALELSKLPVEDNYFMGSCSAGGKCSYHEEVKGGNLLTTYDGTERFALKSEWQYIDNAAKGSEFASRDTKFKLSSTDMKNNRYVIIFNTAGYPGEAPGTLVSDPFSVTSSSELKGKGSVSIEANESGTLKIAGWDGKQWKTFDTKVEGNTATAQVDLMELYVVVK